MTTSYWPWWAGALALGFVAGGFFLAVRRALGVSGFIRRLVELPSELRTSRAEAALAADAALMQQALLEATMEAMGEQAPREIATPPPPAAGPVAEIVPWTAQALFLVMLIVGGTLAAYARGSLSLQLSAGPVFEGLFGGGAGGWAALLGGGVLVGFGTRMAGGCTSGHGLSGVARFQASSLVATAAFFGAGVLVSLALARFT